LSLFGIQVLSLCKANKLSSFVTMAKVISYDETFFDYVWKTGLWAPTKFHS
jgi:hypothetical protein